MCTRELGEGAVGKGMRREKCEEGNEEGNVWRGM